MSRVGGFRSFKGLYSESLGYAGIYKVCGCALLFRTSTVFVGCFYYMTTGNRFNYMTIP